MALPAMFPGLEPPDFVRSEEVEEVARTVLSKHGKVGGVDRLFDVAVAIRQEEIRVLFLLNIKPFDPLRDEAGHDVAGRCIKAPRLWADITGISAAIWIREVYWSQVPDDVREAMVLHELLHLDTNRDDDGRVRLRVRKHDVEDFVDVARHYGPVVGAAAAYQRALALNADPPDPAQGPRPVQTEVFDDQEED